MLADLISTVSDHRRRPPLELDAPPEVAHFALGRELGRGGMGLVYEARDLVLQRRVALKLVRVSDGMLAQARARHLREAQALARIDHPNVVQVFEAGVAGDECYLAMELVDGPTLQMWMRVPRPWRVVVELFLAVGRGLAHVHALGLVHRDVKPSNVFIDRAGTPKLGDFGLVIDVGARDALAVGTRSSKSRGTSSTTAGHVLGTPAYMAPEQRSGHRADPRADQYALCASLHEALTGALPAPERPSMFSVPRALQRVVARGLAVDPADRWPSMASFLGALEATCHNPIWRLAAALKAA
jgi:serine/threonine protein kinase